MEVDLGQRKPDRFGGLACQLPCPSYSLFSHSNTQNSLFDVNKAIQRSAPSSLGCFLILESNSRSTLSRLKFGKHPADTTGIPIPLAPLGADLMELDHIKILWILLALLPGVQNPHLLIDLSGGDGGCRTI